MSDFNRVCEFNKSFDFPIFEPNDVSQEAAACYALRIALINEELDELFEAVKQNDVIEEMDACGDILYVAYGMAYSYGCNFDEVIARNFPPAPYPKRSKSEMLESLAKLKAELNVLGKQDQQDRVNSALIIAQHIIYGIYEYQFNMNFNAAYIFDVIHKSNMTKLCDTEEEAAQTVAMYIANYADRFDSPYYYRLDSGKYVIKNKSSGKSLKSINYVKVKFDMNQAINL